MKIGFVHNDPRYTSGTNYINKLLEQKLAKMGIETAEAFPDPDIWFCDFPANLRGTLEMLVFFSACRHKEKLSDCDFVYGTTYSAIAYLGYSKKVISHFGSTMMGITEALTDDDSADFGWFWNEIIENGILKNIDFDAKNDRFLNDIMAIEKYTAQKAAIVIAASQNVKKELLAQGVAAGSVHLVHNAIEDFWFQEEYPSADGFGICYIGRIGNRQMDWKIKGMDRLVDVYKKFGDIKKTSIILTGNEKMAAWMGKTFKNNHLFVNLAKLEIKDNVSKLRGYALIMPSRYEGFGLTLIEGMSQGLIPVSFDVGIAAEAINQGENGFIVNSVEEMKNKIEWLDKHKDARIKMSRAAIAASRNFNADSMANKFIDIIKNQTDS